MDGCIEEFDEIYGIHWPFTPTDTVSDQSCGDGNILGKPFNYMFCNYGLCHCFDLYAGLVTCPCNSSGDWLSINDTQCQSRLFKEILILVRNV